MALLRMSLYVVPVTADMKSSLAAPSSEQSTIQPSDMDEFTVSSVSVCHFIPVSVSVRV